MCCSMVHYFNNFAQVARHSNVLGITRLMLITPKPKPYRTVFTILRPLNATVWILTILAVVITSTIFALISTLESTFNSRDGDKWTSLIYCGFYFLGTLVGESIVDTTKDNTIRRSRPLRILLQAWLMLAFIISSGYSGNLRAFLLLPEIDPPIGSLTEVVNGDIPWDFTLLGWEGEVELRGNGNKDVALFLGQCN